MNQLNIYDLLFPKYKKRVMTLRDLGVNPFVMGYIDFDNPNYKRPKEIKDFCRWVNMKTCFKSCTWEEYKRGR